MYGCWEKGGTTQSVSQQQVTRPIENKDRKHNMQRAVMMHEVNSTRAPEKKFQKLTKGSGQVVEAFHEDVKKTKGRKKCVMKSS